MTRANRYVHANVNDEENEDKEGFYPTWPLATAALLARETFTGPIWECACGEGDMSTVLIDHGYDVISTDLVDRGYGQPGVDFLMEWRPLAPNIVTNPPFKLWRPFARKALELATGKVAMFAKVQSLCGLDMKRLADASPLARIYMMSRRPPMQRGRLAVEGDKGGMMDFVWFVWDREYTGPAPLTYFLDWKDPNA